MQRIKYNSLNIFSFIEKLGPQNSGIFFSIFFHLIILLFAVGLPNFFGPKDIFVPNIIPIEILNVSETTNFQKTGTKKETNKNIVTKQNKFNSSETTEIQKQFEISQNVKTIDQDKPVIKIKEKNNLLIEQKKNKEIKQKQNIQKKNIIETFKTKDIKPKLKPKIENTMSPVTTTDVEIEPKNKEEKKVDTNKVNAKPQPKPKEDFSIASMLKDLRNEQSNIVENEKKETSEIQQKSDNEQTENMILSITEIDLLRQQLSSCWNAPAGAVINIGDKVTISAKVQQNMKVFANTVRIVDTNISKSNPFYGPITDSAMRTLLNPECTPLKLPKDKYNLWKNLTITFDYSIMKGY